jgi:hypothetical protein
MMRIDPLEKKPQANAMAVLLAGAAALVAVGLAIAGTASPLAGGVVVVAGWLLFVYGLHGYGRAGSVRRS